MSFGEVLKEFKDSESPEYVVPLVDDAELRSGVIAWKSVVIHIKDIVTDPPENDAERWNWLWLYTEFDKNQFAVIAGVRPQSSSALVSRIIGLRLVYPDGTVNKYASQYLQSIIIAQLARSKKAHSRNSAS